MIYAQSKSLATYMYIEEATANNTGILRTTANPDDVDGALVFSTFGAAETSVFDYTYLNLNPMQYMSHRATIYSHQSAILANRNGPSIVYDVRIIRPGGSGVDEQ